MELKRKEKIQKIKTMELKRKEKIDDKKDGIEK